MALIYNGSQINSLIYNGVETTGVWNGDIVWSPVPPPSFDEVTIGTQTWMAKNLDVDDGQSGIYTQELHNVNGVDMGTQYYYTLDAAVRIASSIRGWHLPTGAEFETLIDYIGSSTAGTKLKSTNGWSNNGNGTDDYDFCALPVGLVDTNELVSTGTKAWFWTSTHTNGNYYRTFYLTDTSNTAAIAAANKVVALSLRLIKDT